MIFIYLKDTPYYVYFLIKNSFEKSVIRIKDNSYILPKKLTENSKPFVFEIFFCRNLRKYKFYNGPSVDKVSVFTKIYSIILKMRRIVC